MIQLVKDKADSSYVEQLFERAIHQPQRSAQLGHLYVQYMLGANKSEERVRPVLLRMLEVEPDHIQARLQLLSYAAKRNDIDEIIAICSTAIDYTPEVLEFYYYKGIGLYQKECYEAYGLHFIHASDEWYISAGREFPEEERYDGYIQLENGVGMLRLLMNEFDDAMVLSFVATLAELCSKAKAEAQQREEEQRALYVDAINRVVGEINNLIVDCKVELAKAGEFINDDVNMDVQPEIDNYYNVLADATPCIEIHNDDNSSVLKEKFETLCVVKSNIELTKANIVVLIEALASKYRQHYIDAAMASLNEALTDASEKITEIADVVSDAKGELLIAENDELVSACDACVADLNTLVETMSDETLQTDSLKVES